MNSGYDLTRPYNTTLFYMEVYPVAKHKNGSQEPITPEPITQEQPTPEPVKAEPTTEELMAQLQSALDSHDYKLVASVSRQIDQRERGKEKAELEAKRAAVAKMEETVKSVITESITPLINSGELDSADGIWFSYDFGEQSPSVRLLKTTTRARTGGGGTGKKFDISTEDMLSKHGSEQYKDGMTFKEAYDSNSDKNWRYAIRQKLLKVESII